MAQNQQQYQNPYAGPALTGINSPWPNGFVDIPFSYVYNNTVADGALYPNLSQNVDTDADFVWRALLIGADTGGGFLIRFIDAHGYYLSNAMTASAIFSSNGASPYPIFPELVYPAGSRIAFDFESDNNGGTTVQLIFLGVKRYRLPE